MHVGEAAVHAVKESRRGGLRIAITIAVVDESGLADQVVGDILNVADDIIDGEDDGNELAEQLVGGAL